MFERLHTPQEIFNFKLGAALKMERTVLDMLSDNIEAAQDEAVKQELSHHQDETRQHVQNLERAFGLLDWEIDDSPCPAIEGIQKEGKANVKKTDDAVVDSVIVSGAIETEHHEIAVYESLITMARHMGRQDVAELLERNLEQERHTLDEAHQALERLAAVGATQPA